MTKLDELIAAEKRCQDSCSDYACLRRGECTGVAGSNLQSFINDETKRRKEEQDFERQYQLFKKLADKYFAERKFNLEVKND